VLGLWCGECREPVDVVGSRSVMARFGWQPKLGGLVETTYRNLDNRLYSGRPYETAHILEARYSRRWEDFYVGAELMRGHDVFGESFTRVGGFIRF
jgi:hypothetical protein